MATQPILNPESIDLKKVVMTHDEILAINPQRYEFEQIDTIVHYDAEEDIIVGIKEQKEDLFWTKAHIPGRPLQPGVLMIEMAAQVSSILYNQKMGAQDGKFFGFGGVDKIKFRGEVNPGETLIMVVKGITLRKRIAKFYAQAFANDGMVFEGEITGVII